MRRGGWELGRGSIGFHILLDDGSLDIGYSNKLSRLLKCVKFKFFYLYLNVVGNSKPNWCCWNNAGRRK